MADRQNFILQIFKILNKTVVETSNSIICYTGYQSLTVFAEDLTIIYMYMQVPIHILVI